MIEETVRAVKDAESKADQTVTEAKARASDIVRSARAEADQIRDDAQKEAGKKYEERMARARAVGEASLSDADRQMQKEAEDLKAGCVSKEDAAVDRVIQKLLCQS